MEFIIFSLTPVLFYLIIRTKKSLHMLQQNWYNEGNRYLKWIFKNKKEAINIFEVITTLIILVSFVLFLSGLSLNINFLYSFIFIIYIYYGYSYYKKVKKEQSKIPLAVTKRVRRLIITISIIYLIPILFYFLTGFTIYYTIILFLTLVTFNFFIVMIANIINKPIERQVYHYYRRKAINKLKSLKHMQVIGITGSYGKTSSKNILSDILNTKIITTPTPKNFNTPYGLIQSINNHLDKFSGLFIAEMGAFKKGEIKELCDLVTPKYGILTSIGVAHLESFGSRENIQVGKFELIESLPSDGVGILNSDDDYQVNYKLKNNCKIIWIGIDNKNADVVATNIKMSHLKMSFDVIFKDNKEKHTFETNILGRANIYNILAGIALGRELGLKIEELKSGVKSIKSTPHRLELKKVGNINIIDDAYNSNPTGAKMALEVLNMMPGKKIIVTPGMIELSDKQYEYNKEFGKQIAYVADEVILVGVEQTKPIYDGLIERKYNLKNIHVLNDVKKAFALIKELQSEETFVLLENDLPDIFNE